MCMGMHTDAHGQQLQLSSVVGEQLPELPAGKFMGEQGLGDKLGGGRGGQGALGDIWRGSVQHNLWED